MKQGMNPELIEKGYVFDVSDTLAFNFEKEGEAFISLAERCGLTQDDLKRIQEAKKRLASFNPSNHKERMAKRGLESLFTLGNARKVQAGQKESPQRNADNYAKGQIK